MKKTSPPKNSIQSSYSTNAKENTYSRSHLSGIYIKNAEHNWHVG
jgi:hypothetical protein